MKNIIIVILLAAAVAFGALFISQQNKAKTQAAQLAQTQAQLASAEALSKEKTEAVENASLAETKARILQDTLKDTAASVVEQSNQVAQLKAAQTNAPANPFAAMFKDPKMKEMIKSQQKLVMGPMIDKSYAAAFKQLNLSPEQTAGLKDLLQNKMLAGADVGMAMMDGSLDADKRAELTKQVKADSDAYDAKIKDLLGDENYQNFEKYEKTVPDRMAVSQFHDQLASSGNQMSADQEQQLVQAMSDERTKFKWTTDYTNNNPPDGDLSAMFSEDKLNTFASEKERYDGQVLVRAKQILTPEQYATFETHQAQQREMQIAGMKIAASMFHK